MEKTIAVLEGDGIGPEIVGEGIKVLKAVEQRYGHIFHLNYAPFGAQAYFTHGSPFPKQTQVICDHADAIIKGPVGLAVEKMNTIPQQFRPEIGAILGSLGLMPSACIGPDKGYVEAAHGSASDIAGKNIANPYSMIGSVAFLLDKCFGLTLEAHAVWNALVTVFERGFLTAELATADSNSEKVLSTTAFGDMVVDILIEK